MLTTQILKSRSTHSRLPNSLNLHPRTVTTEANLYTVSSARQLICRAAEHVSDCLTLRHSSGFASCLRRALTSLDSHRCGRSSLSLSSVCCCCCCCCCNLYSLATSSSSSFCLSTHRVHLYCVCAHCQQILCPATTARESLMNHHYDLFPSSTPAILWKLAPSLIFHRGLCLSAVLPVNKIPQMHFSAHSYF